MVERLIIVISHVDVMMSGASTALHLRLTLVPTSSLSSTSFTSLRTSYNLFLQWLGGVPYSLRYMSFLLTQLNVFYILIGKP